MALLRCSGVLVALLALGLAGRAAGFAVNIDAHDEECFFEDTKTGTKLGLTFQVAEGGFLDIDVTVRHSRERAREDRCPLRRGDGSEGDKG